MAMRKYEQRLRAETAEETRRRILDALLERIREAPAERVSVDEIARRARVARSTVYAIFGSRAGLFKALSKDVTAGAGWEQLLEAVRAPDARESLRGGVEGGVRMFAANRDVFRVLSSMAELDPDAVGEAVKRAGQIRAEGMAQLAARLAEQGLLREGLTPERAAHVAWLLSGFDAFDALYTGRGLSAEETAEILQDVAERALLA